MQAIHHSKPWLGEAERQAVAKLIDTGMLADGRAVREFEATLAAYLSAPKVFACASGTHALVLALKALRLKARDEVILPTYVCHSVMSAVDSVGATPVLCDVGPAWNMTPDTVRARLTPRTKAIVLVHIFGIVEPVERFKTFGVPVIEDFCQALDRPDTYRTEARSDTIWFFSFHAIKCLTTGRGGAVAARSAELTERLAAVAQEEFPPVQMTDIQAAIGLAQLARFAGMLERRKAIAERYFRELPAHLTSVARSVAARSMFFRFPLRAHAEEFGQLRERFARDGVMVRQGVDELLHRRAGLPDADYPCATACYGETVSLPIYPGLTEPEVDTVIVATLRNLAEES